MSLLSTENAETTQNSSSSRSTSFHLFEIAPLYPARVLKNMNNVLNYTTKLFHLSSSSSAATETSNILKYVHRAETLSKQHKYPVFANDRLVTLYIRFVDVEEYVKYLQKIRFRLNLSTAPDQSLLKSNPQTPYSTNQSVVGREVTSGYLPCETIVNSTFPVDNKPSSSTDAPEPPNNNANILKDIAINPDTKKKSDSSINKNDNETNTILEREIVEALKKILTLKGDGNGATKILGRFIPRENSSNEFYPTYELPKLPKLPNDDNDISKDETTVFIRFFSEELGEILYSSFTGRVQTIPLKLRKSELRQNNSHLHIEIWPDKKYQKNYHERLFQCYYSKEENRPMSSNSTDSSTVSPIASVDSSGASNPQSPSTVKIPYPDVYVYEIYDIINKNISRIVRKRVLLSTIKIRDITNGLMMYKTIFGVPSLYLDHVIDSNNDKHYIIYQKKGNGKETPKISWNIKNILQAAIKNGFDKVISRFLS